jgi:hypothetical protein
MNPTLVYLSAAKSPKQRQRAEGRRQKGRFFFPLPKGYQAPKFIYDEEKKDFFPDT